MSKLAEKLMHICGTDEDGYGIDNLTARQLKSVETALIKHLNFDRIEWMESPVEYIEGVHQIVTHTMKLADNNPPTYENKIGYIYKVMFSPVMYDPTAYVKPVKNGCSITPVVYNPINFEPTKHIMLSWNPEGSGDDDARIKLELMDKLYDILKNPEEYMQKGYRSVLLRFAVVDNGTPVSNTNGTGNSNVTPTR